MNKTMKKLIIHCKECEEYHEKLEKKGKVSISNGVTWRNFSPDKKRHIQENFADLQISTEREYSNIDEENEEILLHVANLRSQNKRNYIVNNFHDKNLIYAMRIFLHEIFETQFLLQDTFLGSKRLGDYSAYGVAMYSKRGNVTFKISKYGGVEEMRHEFIIGSILSNLRNQVPNFVSVYDVIEVGTPIISLSGQVVQACNPGEKITGVAVYEYVNEAKAISEIEDPVQFLSCFTQTILALYFAYQKYDFSHNDCHDQNVLAYKYSDSDFYINYKFGSTNIYIKTKGLVSSIIDYGQSHVLYQGIHYGILDYENGYSVKGIYPDLSNPCNDQFKFLMMNIKAYKNSKNTEILNICTKLAGYFFKTPQIEMREYEMINLHLWDQRYTIRPETVQHMKWEPLEFVFRCLDLCKVYEIIETEKPERVLGEIQSELRYSDPEPFDYEWKEWNIDLPREYFTAFDKKPYVQELEKNFDQMARFISFVIFLRETGDEKYTEYKGKADSMKNGVERSFERIRTILYGKKSEFLSPQISELNYIEDTKHLKKLFDKIISIVGSFLEL